MKLPATKIIAVLATLLSAMVLCAQSLPDAPRAHVHVIDKKFIVIEVALAGAIAVDGYSTANFTSCYESNPILGKHPSTAKVTVFMAAQFVGVTALDYTLKRFAGKRMRGAAWLLPSAYNIVDHTRAGISNIRRC